METGKRKPIYIAGGILLLIALLFLENKISSTSVEYFVYLMIFVLITVGRDFYKARQEPK